MGEENLGSGGKAENLRKVLFAVLCWVEEIEGN
jgi:hypothetical protein